MDVELTEEILDQSQPMYDSDNAVDYTEEVQEMNQALENKIVNRNKIRFSTTRIKYSPTRIKSRNFYQTSRTLELAKLIFIMIILFWMCTCYLLKI